MADDVEMIPVDGGEPPKKPATLKLNPLAQKPAGATAALKPGLKLPPKPTFGAGLKLPPKPGATVALKPGLKLPTKPTLGAGLKLPPKPAPMAVPKPVPAAAAPVAAAPAAAPKPAPVAAAPVAAAPAAAPKPAPAAVPKPGATVALKPGVKLPPKPAFGAGLKLPPKPGATVSALKPGLKLPPKPGATVSAMKPGLKLPTKPMIRKPGEAAAPAPLPKPLEQLKSVTQKLKGITQEIPQQAILHKTGIIAGTDMSEAQREAAKHKTARISLSDALGVAPVKEEAAPMKTIRIKRPVDIPGAAPAAAAPAAAAPAAAADAPAADSAPAPAAQAASAPAAESAPAAPAANAPDKPAPTLTQRKTLKIARPGAAVRPTGKFGAKRPGAPTIAKPAAKPADANANSAGAGDAAVADIPDLPNTSPMAPVPMAAPAPGPSWVWTLSAIVQLAACGVIGALAWFLYENAQLATFCGGLGWGA